MEKKILFVNACVRTDSRTLELSHHLLDKLEGVEKEQRTARFVCAIAAVLPDKQVLTTVENMEGYIGYAAEGEKDLDELRSVNRL